MNTPIPLSNRKCTRCGRGVKQGAEFVPRSDKRHLVRAYCRDCGKITTRERVRRLRLSRGMTPRPSRWKE